MSHFAVMVMIDPKEVNWPPDDTIDSYLDKVLAPFDESTENQEFMEFVDTMEEGKEEYETGSTILVELPDGRRLSPWDEEFRVPGEIGYGSNTHRPPKNSTTVEVPFKERFSSFDEYMTYYRGEEKDSETGKYGYWSNPNAKWDWYTVGGRFEGLPCSRGYRKNDCGTGGDAELARLEKMLFSGDKRPYVPSDCDIAKLKDCNFGSDKAKYDDAIAFWEHHVEGKPSDRKFDEWDTFFKPEWYVDRYGDKETYALAESMYTPMTVITPDGQWHEKGEMGWFGVSNETHEEALEWELGFYEDFLKDADPETVLVKVDCHI